MRETPRDAEGNKICQGCDGPIVQSGIGRSRDYCSRLCRDRAYKRRRDQRIRDEAVAAAVRDVSPSAETRRAPDESPDGETRARGTGRVVRPGTLSGRRPLLPPPPGIRRPQPEPPTLFDE